MKRVVIALAAVAFATAAAANSILLLGAGSGSSGGVAPMPQWQAALALQRAGTRNAKVAIVGDSTTAGFGATSNNWKNAKVASYPDVLARAFLAGSPQSFFGDQNLPGSGVPDTTNNYDPRLVLASGWASDTNNSFGSKLFINTTTTNALSFTPTKAFDTIEIWYPTNAGLGTISYDVDGGAGTNIDENAAINYSKTTAVVALGTHTVNINRVSGSAYLGGIVTYNSASKEISVYNAGWSGAKAADWASTTFAFSPQPALQAIAPDLTVLCLGINDWNAGTNVATFTTSMQSIITAAKASGDVILVAPPQTDPTLGVSAATQQQYIDALQTLATTNGLNFINLTARWGGYAGANASGFMSDQTHPSGKGYIDWKSAVLSIAGDQNEPYAFSNSEGATYVAAMSVAPDSSRKALIDTWIEGLKRAAIWSVLDAAYLRAAHDSQAALLNAKAPASFLSSLVDNPTFTVDRGYTTDGVNDAIDSGFNPVTAAGNYTQNSAMYAVSVLNENTFTSRPLGWFDGTDGVGMIPRVAGDEFNFRANQATSSATTDDSATTSIRLWAANRSAAGATQAYRGGTALTVGSNPNQASTALNSHDLMEGNGASGEFQVIQVGAVYIGASLSAAKHVWLASIDLYWMKVVGAR